MLNPKALSAFLSKEPNRLPREDVALFVDRSEAIERFRHTLATGEPYVAMRTVGRGQDVPEVEAYDWRIERVTLSDGRFGVVCYFYDLTERQPLPCLPRRKSRPLSVTMAWPLCLCRRYFGN